MTSPRVRPQYVGARPGFAGLLALACLSLIATACGAGELRPATSAASIASAQPRDVRDFVGRRQQCDHFRGEDAGDAKRQAQLDAKLTEYCTGTDAQLAALKRKYKTNTAVMKSLGGFDNHIE